MFHITTLYYKRLKNRNFKLIKKNLLFNFFFFIIVIMFVFFYKIDIKYYNKHTFII